MFLAFADRGVLLIAGCRNCNDGPRRTAPPPTRNSKRQTGNCSAVDIHQENYSLGTASVDDRVRNVRAIIRRVSRIERFGVVA